MFEIIELTLEQSGAYKSIKPMLYGNIFHVTPQHNLASILHDREIRPNDSGNLEGAFGKFRKSYARVRSRVSLFDFHNPPGSEIEKNIYKCLPTSDASADTPLAFLFLAEVYWFNVIPYSSAEFDANSDQQIVPHVEATCLGAIPLEAIDRIIKATFTEDPNSMANILNRSRNNAL
ncbi:hypothetical protein [endosymbiont of unidentified scaly snail isolate Monju]|uniref:hypothetical protein n=1 Tax=endosymbiont of unidentified scaly snail isolate Monju TaxID=1248727 RepID=UPI0011DCE95C|nr:hypothetical protein [endosymbiont of unidentified scaly snail isolate Monju]